MYNLQNRNRSIEIENRLMVARKGGRRLDWEFGISRCKLLHRDWVNHKVLQDSTGAYTEYPVINHKNMKETVYN